MRRFPLLAFLLLASPARAATTTELPPPVSVTPDLVCRVQHAIRWREKAWEPWQCLRIAAATNHAADATGQRADVLLAIQINESDLRQHALKWYRREWRNLGPGDVGDLGIMGVRCRLGRDLHCSNGLVRGMKYPQLLHPETNILVGARILAKKRRLNDYNGGDGYAGRICAIVAALGGVAKKVDGHRMKKLVRQIAASVAAPERKS